MEANAHFEILKDYKLHTMDQVEVLGDDQNKCITLDGDYVEE